MGRARADDENDELSSARVFCTLGANGSISIFRTGVLASAVCIL